MNIEWINCDDRMPEQKQDCLAIDVYGDMETVYFDESNRWQYLLGCNCCGRISLLQITHWIPIAKPNQHISESAAHLRAESASSNN